MKIPPISRNTYILIALLALAAVLRIYRLDFQSPWLDEIHTLNDADPKFSFSEVMASLSKWDLHPPLYFYVIQILFKIFGYTIVVARAFSAVMGIAAVFAIYKLGKELYSESAGLVAALMLTVNDYHIYYSQDARPYTMYALFTICSFIYLIKFIKTPNRLNAVWYGIFTAMMLYGHLFGIFTLTGQMAVILFFAIISKKEARKPFLLNAVLSGVIAFVLFLPSAKIIYAATLVKKFWIRKPPPDVLWRFYSEFFKHSQMIRFIVGALAIFYLIKLIKDRDFSRDYSRMIQNKMVFATIIIASWIGFTMVPPLIKSIVSTPIFIDRYFINIVPAIILIAAIGFCQLKFTWVKLGVAVLILGFSLNNLIVFRKYYNTVTKAQYRELTALMNAQVKPGEPIATSLAWHFGQFFQNHGHNHEVVDANLDRYVNKMMTDSIPVKPFWYADSQGRYYNVKPETQQFLDKHFVLTEKIEKYDIWTHHYELAPANPTSTDAVTDK